MTSTPSASPASSSMISAAARRSILFTALGLLVALELGGFVRFVFLSSGDFPLNDGGLFYVMAQDIARSGYALPVASSYNGIGMPYAYPPLGFYLAALFSNAYSLIDVVRFLPALINLLTILAFYGLARTILKSPAQSMMATFTFAMLPRAFKFLIMGGGLSRSPGFLFAILLMQQAYLLYTVDSTVASGKRRHLLLAILFGVLTVLSHPEMALYAAVSSCLFFLFRRRTRQGLIDSLLVCAGVIALTAPWWLTVLSRYGVAPFLAAYNTGEQSLVVSIALLLTGVGFVEQSLLGVIALIGAVRGIANRRYLLTVWLIAIFAVVPRSAQTFAVIVVALLVGIELDEFIFPALRRVNLARAILGFMLIVYSIFTAINTSIPVLKKEERAAMQWAAQNTPEGSRFVLVTGYNWYEDAISEWFPIVAGRNSLATVQGYEWFAAGRFQQQQKWHKDLQKCADEGLACLEKWQQETGVSFEYIYLSHVQAKSSALEATLSTSSSYQRVYIEAGAAIFKKL